MEILTILILLIIVIVLWFLYDRKSSQGFPPGPPRLPLVGNLLHIVWESRYPSIAFQKLADKYGDENNDLVSLRLGQRYSIVFNSYESIKFILGHEDCQDRVQDMVQLVKEYLNNQNLGIGFSNGFEWQTFRQFTIKTLRNLGFGKSATMDVIINEEVDKLVHYIENLMHKSPEGISNLKSTFGLSTINILWRFLTGNNYELGNEKMHEVAEISAELFKAANFGIDGSTFFPFLYDWIPCWRENHMETQRSLKMRTFLESTLEQHRILGDYKTQPKCYIDYFLAKIDEQEREWKDGGALPVFTPVQLFTCIADLFEAGGDTTSSTLVFSILYLINNENVQEKVHQEIEMTLGKDEMITMDFKSKLPYTFATVLECLRYSTVIPIDIPRVPKRDLVYKNHLIKKGTILIPNLYSISVNKSTWGDPQNFRPERFLNEDGTALDQTVTSKLMNFGHGPRYCLGSGMGESVLFIYLSTIVRKFKIKSVSGEGLDSEPELGMTYSPKPFKAKFIKRN